jgi:CheY-like chemotaxis protein
LRRGEGLGHASSILAATMQRRTAVLLVDDDPAFRAVMAEVLAAEGCTVCEAADAAEAMEILRVALPDLILLDLMMPGMTGWAFYAVLQRDARLAQVPVAILSAVARLRPTGVTRVLRKPVDLPNLLALLATVDHVRARAGEAD